jgi:hypothetical protein
MKENSSIFRMFSGTKVNISVVSLVQRCNAPTYRWVQGLFFTNNEKKIISNYAHKIIENKVRIYRGCDGCVLSIKCAKAFLSIYYTSFKLSKYGKILVIAAIHQIPGYSGTRDHDYVLYQYQNGGTFLWPRIQDPEITCRVLQSFPKSILYVYA